MKPNIYTKENIPPLLGLYLDSVGKRDLGKTLAEFENAVIYLLPIHLATNFHIRLTKTFATELIKEGRGDNVMCKEYGDDEEWVGMSIDDIDQDTGRLDDDYLTFEYFSDSDEDLKNTVTDLIHHEGEGIEELFSLLRNNT